MRSLVAAAIVLIGTTAVEAQKVTRYTILFQGKAGGSQTTRITDGSNFTVEFSYRDNGRGPDLKEEFSLAADGTLRRYQGKGTSTFGAAIEESFERAGDKAEWKSTSGQGSTTLKGPAIYVPVECSSEAMARVIRAVALRTGGRLNALPGGELNVEKLVDERVEVDGKKREVSLYALKGLFEEPLLVWMTREPELVLFASILPGWMQVIEEGWDSVASQLEKRQVEVNDSLLNKLASKLSIGCRNRS
jgi:hypothetical protein